MDVFSGKANGTLQKRGGSLMQFVKWCRTGAAPPVPPFPLQESTCYSYLQYLKASASPTTAQAFVESLAFARITIGLKGTEDVLSSRRVTGAADLMLSSKAPLRQCDALTLEEVVILETLVEVAPSLADRCAAGACCFCLYGRLRASDLARMHDLQFDLAADGSGFVEGRARFTKTATSRDKKARFLPVVAIVYPLARSKKSWAQWWQIARCEAKLDNEPFVQPPPSTGDLWLQRPLTAGELGRWLNDLLNQLRHRPANAYIGSHSLKTTMLSWLAKHGATAADRRLLGGHTDSNDVSLLTYSRDALASPLRCLAKMLRDVKEQRFKPDLGRSGRFVGGASDSLAAETNLDGFIVVDPAVPPADDSAGPPVVVEVAPALPSSSTSSSSSSSSSGSDSDQAAAAAIPIVSSDLFEVPFGMLPYVHQVLKTLHLRRATVTSKLLCGRSLHSGYQRVPSAVSLQHAQCKQCFHMLRTAPP
jgi:hypothetical protein